MESRPGEILIAGMRMCLLDVATSLFSLRKSLEAIIGPAVATIFYDAGFQGALKYAESIVTKNLIRADEAGFREALTEYSDGGFGRFEIVSIDFPAGQATISCTDPASAEAHAFMANRDRRKQPGCDFSRGILVGLFSGIGGRTGLAAFEESCRAAGDDACVFRIGAKDAIERLSIERSAARRHRGAATRS
jgi:predicted hydrocarbon binding protein